MSNFQMWLVSGLIMVFLLAGFVISGLFSYWGVGIQQIGPRHLRAGSVSGPGIVGGGPGSGK